jgi:hypothetical protein
MWYGKNIIPITEISPVNKRDLGTRENFLSWKIFSLGLRSVPRTSVSGRNIFSTDLPAGIYIYFTVAEVFISFFAAELLGLLNPRSLTWDWDEVKPEWNWKLSTCLHETGTKITTFSIYFLCQAICFFRWLLLACVVPMSRLQPRPVWNVFVFTFIPVWMAYRSEVSRSSRRIDLRPVWVIFVLISCKHLYK